MLAIADGLIRGLLLIGQNPVIGGHNSKLVRKGLGNLEWMVVRETFENETASFWYKSPEAQNGAGPRAQDIKTEIFLLPAALPEKRKEVLPIPNGCFSGMTEWSTLRGIVDRIFGSCFTWESA